MSIKTVRIAADIKNVGRCIDEYTGKAPVIYRDESINFEVAIFNNDQIVTAAEVTQVSMWIIKASNGDTLLSSNVSSLNTTLTAKQWRTGASELATLAFGSGFIASLPAEELILRLNVTHVGGENNIYLYAKVQCADRSPVTAFSTPEPPDSYYTKSECDTNFASKGLFETAQEDIEELQAAILTEPSGVVLDETYAVEYYDLPFETYPGFALPLTEDVELTYTSGGKVGSIHPISITQDATGNRQVTYDTGLFEVKNDAIINPLPSAETLLRFNTIRRTSSSPVLVSPLLTPTLRSQPAYLVDLRIHYRCSISSSTLVSFTDPISGMVCTSVGTATAHLTSGLNGRPALNPTGTTYYTLGAGATNAPISSSSPAASGMTVAVVFDSRDVDDARLLDLGPLGISIDQRAGNLEFGSRSATGNRVAIPFTPNDSLATLAIFTRYPTGISGATGVVIKAGSDPVSAYNSAAAAGTTATDFNLLQKVGGTDRWTGRVAYLAIFNYALTWDEQQALAATLCAGFGINQ